LKAPSQQNSTFPIRSFILSSCSRLVPHQAILSSSVWTNLDDFEHSSLNLMIVFNSKIPASNVNTSSSSPSLLLCRSRGKQNTRGSCPFWCRDMNIVLRSSVTLIETTAHVLGRTERSYEGPSGERYDRVVWRVRTPFQYSTSAGSVVTSSSASFSFS
jgi:hypothetical protein